EISTIASTLKEYIGYVNTVHLQDSLLGLSSMSDNQLSDYVDKLIEQQKQAEEARQQKELDELNRLNDPNLFNQFGEKPTKRGSEFYFDTPDLVTNGKVEFQQLWGTRKNEDNWRRKNKALQVKNSEDEEEGEEVAELSEEDLEKYGSAEKARMIKNVPRDAETKAAAHQKIEEALYGLGQVYANKLNDQDSAIAVFRRLIRRYPDSEYALKGRYALYKIYTDREDFPMADRYENEICGKYPSSRYCKYCRNEEVLAENDQEFKEFNGAYKALLETFGRKEYQTCIDFSNFITMRFSAEEGLAEVLMVRGKCYGYLSKKDSLKSIYEHIVMNYPDSDVIPEVNRTLDFLNGKSVRPINPGGGTNPGTNDNPRTGNNPAYRGFTIDRKPHEKVYVVMLIDKGDIKSIELQLKLNAFNQRTYPEKRLNASIFLYKNQFHMPYISQFENEKAAMGYIREIMNDVEISNFLNREEEKIVFITPGNFRTAYGKKRFEDYFLYYTEVVIPSVTK
ncbi:MAG: tetratricopeptide repeat protein, partial [Bacteroidota bacterium]